MQTKRITANLPAALLAEAQEIVGTGITETLVAGLEALVRREALERSRRLRGKIQLREDSGRKNVETRD